MLQKNKIGDERLQQLHDFDESFFANWGFDFATSFLSQNYAISKKHVLQNVRFSSYFNKNGGKIN